jgi:predicted histidine transporter YuiF (NhaC family)
MKVMVLGLRGDLKCTWHALDRGLLGLNADALEYIMLGSIAASVCLSALTGTRSSFWLIPPIKLHFYGNDLQHNKTLKLTKTLENIKLRA